MIGAVYKKMSRHPTSSMYGPAVPWLMEIIGEKINIMIIFQFVTNLFIHDNTAIQTSHEFWLFTLHGILFKKMDFKMPSGE